MVDRNLIREFAIDEDELNSVFSSVMEVEGGQGFDRMIVDSPFFETGKILSGVVLRAKGMTCSSTWGARAKGLCRSPSGTKGRNPGRRPEGRSSARRVR